MIPKILITKLVEIYLFVISQENRTFYGDKIYHNVGVRHPIESFFNWLIEKTDFQRANKVRSAKGLLILVFGKPAIEKAS